MRLGNYDVMFNHNVEERQTTCNVFNVDAAPLHSRTPIYSGISKCYETDAFCKRVGRKIAMTRAIRSLSRPARKQVWADYKAQGVTV